MKCANAKCNFHDTDVVDSRKSEIYGADTVRRRRICRKCKNKFTTYEISFPQIINIKAAALHNEFKTFLQAALKTAFDKMAEDTLKEDFESKVARFDTANRARKTRHQQEIKSLPKGFYEEA
jgi:transcriptional regulator NrdR family protein